MEPLGDDHGGSRSVHLNSDRGRIVPKRILSLFRNLFRNREIEQALDDELRSSLEALTQEKMQQGLSQSVARRGALIEIGGIEQVKQSVRAVRAGRFVEDLHGRSRPDAGARHWGNDSHFQRGEWRPHPTFALFALGQTRRSRARPSWHQPVQLALVSSGIRYLSRTGSHF